MRLQNEHLLKSLIARARARALRSGMRWGAKQRSPNCGCTISQTVCKLLHFLQHFKAVFVSKLGRLSATASIGQHTSPDIDQHGKGKGKSSL
jgi:hypothetical protein